MFVENMFFVLLKYPIHIHRLIHVTFMNNLVIARMHGMWLIVSERCKPILKSNLTAWRLWYLFARARFCKWGLYGSFVVDYIGIGFKEKCDNNATVYFRPRQIFTQCQYEWRHNIVWFFLVLYNSIQLTIGYLSKICFI